MNAPDDDADSGKNTRTHSVLIVDDENGVRDLLTRWLESGGYSVTTAANAEEALGREERSTEEKRP